MQKAGHRARPFRLWGSAWTALAFKSSLPPASLTPAPDILHRARLGKGFWMNRRLLFWPTLLLATPALAETPQLILPIDCTLGETCYIQQFRDDDPGPGALDFTCGPLTYDGHQGTDFALPSLAAQAAGVAVLAAADGRVRAVRDEMPDILQTGPDAPDINGRDCGNGVVIAHADGWTTQYCHMALGSISVAPGDPVRAGQPIGDVGLSGRTQFPHLHLTVRQNDQVVDPFQPDDADMCGAVGDDTLWISAPNYTPGGLISAGLATGVPDYADIKAGLPPATLNAAAPLVLWGYVFGGRSGDLVQIEITGPDGEVIAHQEALTRTQAQLFRAAGKRAPSGGWPSGTYRGTVRLIRDGQVIDAGDVAATIE